MWRQADSDRGLVTTTKGTLARSGSHHLQPIDTNGSQNGKKAASLRKESQTLLYDVPFAVTLNQVLLNQSVHTQISYVLPV